MPCERCAGNGKFFLLWLLDLISILFFINLVLVWGYQGNSDERERERLESFQMHVH